MPLKLCHNKLIKHSFSRINELQLRSMIGLMLLVISFHSWGFSEARLLNESATGQTVVFNLGRHDDIKEGEYAIIVKQIRSLDQRDLRLVPAARARNVKINTDSSVWIIYHFYDQELLVRGEKFLVFTETNVLRGRKRPDFGRVSAIGKKGQGVKTAKIAMREKVALGALRSKYTKEKNFHAEEGRSAHDGELIDVEEWKVVKNNRYRTALYKSASQDDFSRQLKLETFEKLVTAYIKRLNDPDFNYDAFYEEQMRSSYNNEFRRNSNFDTEYKKFLAEQATKSTADAKLYRSILENGDSWSEEFSDEELRNVLNEVSILQERDRKVFVLAKPTKYAMALSYGSNLTDGQTTKDTRYRRNSMYSIDLDFEVTPILKHDSLERFTISGFFRSNKTATESQSFNTNVDETSLAVGANWYPWYKPYAVESPVVFMGTYIRSGLATLNAPSASESAKYTVLSLPGFRAGLRYIFRNNVGLRIVASMETLKLDRYQTSSVGSVLPDHANLVDGKVGFGMTYSF